MLLNKRVRILCTLRKRYTALIIDVRNNKGGNIDSWILDVLQRKAWMYWQSRSSNETTLWNSRFAFRGHLVVLINEHTSSDGEGKFHYYLLECCCNCDRSNSVTKLVFVFPKPLPVAYQSLGWGSSSENAHGAEEFGFLPTIALWMAV